MMNRKIGLQEAQATFFELVAGLEPGDEIDITQDSQTVAKLLFYDDQRPLIRCPACRSLVPASDSKCQTCGVRL